MEVDYEFRDRTEVESAEELEQLFHDHKSGNLRILGTGTSQDRLPAPPAQTTLVSLRKLNHIERVEEQDLTCSVQPGVLREELDAELEQRGVCLPCVGGGTLGGLFAADSIGVLAPRAHSPRSLLLGISGMLAEGLPFSAGARVVKSVAGFDLQKLFVGSRGRLFAATLLHLKLRPDPPVKVGFRTEVLDRNEALGLFSQLRRRSDPPTAVVLQGRDGGFSVHGMFQGTAPQVSESLSRHDLQEHEGTLPLRVDVDEHSEVLRGQVRPSRLDKLLDGIPQAAPVVITGGGWFEVGLAVGRMDGVLAQLAQIPVSAEITCASPPRRGRGTAMNPNAASIMQGLKMALDPKGVLA